MLSQTERTFLIAIEPPLLAEQTATVVARLRANWPEERLMELADSSSPVIARMAARCLGYIGTRIHARKLTGLLRHADETVVEAAENGLWSIWMRGYEGADHERLREAIGRVNAGEFEAGLALLSELIAAEPNEPEAYHQRALALHSMQRYEEAEAAYLATLERNPAHFAAAAGLGHLHVEQGEFEAALDFYKQALEIHPRLKEIREIVPQLEKALNRRDVA